MTGVRNRETKDEVPVGQSRLTARLHMLKDSPLYDEAASGQAELALLYVDRYENEYRLVVPVTRQKRADGGFNPQFHWQDYKTIEPKLSKKRLREIGAL